MKQLNGEPVARVQLVLDFEFNMEEIDRVISVAPELQKGVLAEIVSRKNPVAESCNGYSLECFKRDAGKSLLEFRERSLRALPAPETKDDVLPF